jgi:prepilin peptidase CpaA
MEAIGLKGMMPAFLPYLPMLALLIWAAIEDVRTRRIRNWLTLSLIVSGLIYSHLGYGTVTPGQAWLGLAAGFFLPFALFLIGALGGGDVKLLAGVGVWLGPTGSLAVFAGAAIIGMVIVLIQCAAKGRLFQLFQNSAVLALSLVHVRELGVEHATKTSAACRSVDRPLPYAVPVLLSVVILVFVK